MADIEIHIIEDLLVLAFAKEARCPVTAAHMIHLEDELLLSFRHSFGDGISAKPGHRCDRIQNTVSHCAHLLSARDPRTEPVRSLPAATVWNLR